VTALAHPRPGAAITRRGLVAAAGAAVVGVALAETTHLAGLARGLGEFGVPAYLRRSSFAGMVGDRFELLANDGRSVARLVAVDDLPAVAHGGAQAGSEDAFALVFHASGAARLEQDVMTLTHPRLGRFALLVSPSGTGRHGQDYAAIINRARPPRRTGGRNV
jgi:hypothetical protein